MELDKVVIFSLVVMFYGLCMLFTEYVLVGVLALFMGFGTLAVLASITPGGWDE